ncbi:MAG: hypothetical protein EOO65_01610 [Methanosarcinales archaeon]|nr:MAG: hypothetical protein EOO65_01610 [Methanosarcinales archaeon]
MQAVTGAILSQVKLERRMWTHPTRDVSILHIENETQVIDSMRAAGHAIEPLRIADQRAQAIDVRARLQASWLQVYA